MQETQRRHLADRPALLGTLRNIVATRHMLIVLPAFSLLHPPPAPAASLGHRPPVHRGLRLLHDLRHRGRVPGRQAVSAALRSGPGPSPRGSRKLGRGCQLGKLSSECRTSPAEYHCRVHSLPAGPCLVLTVNQTCTGTVVTVSTIPFQTHTHKHLSPPCTRRCATLPQRPQEGCAAVRGAVCRLLRHQALARLRRAHGGWVGVERVAWGWARRVGRGGWLGAGRRLVRHPRGDCGSAAEWQRQT